MASVTTQAGGHEDRFLANQRRDNWWVAPLLTFLGLMTFVVYSTWAAFQGVHYYHEPYLSPMYSPPLFSNFGAPGNAPSYHTWFGAFPGWWPPFIPQSPALIILVIPAMFRFTCYYYRKAYYRSFGLQPAGCAVRACPRKNYQGERFLLIFQNLHRLVMYLAVAYIFILLYDAIVAFYHHEHGIGIGVGTVVMLINVFLLAGYTFGCHSLRHMIGGGLNKFSATSFTRFRHGLWKGVTKLNEHHQEWAWTSLFWVGFTDVYIRLVSMGIWVDLNTWGGQ